MPINIFLISALMMNPFFTRDDTLTVIVKNVQTGKGTVAVAIWDDENLFLKKYFVAQSRKADKDTVAFSFVLADGRYAISVYQDINDNQKLDLGLFNIPKEPTGFGNNFRPRFSAPKFKDCAINLTQSATEEIELK